MKSNCFQKKSTTQFLLVERSIAMRNSKITEFKNMWSCILWVNKE